MLTIGFDLDTIQFPGDEELWPMHSSAGNDYQGFPNNFDELYYSNNDMFLPSATDLSISNFYYQQSRTGEGEPFRVTYQFFPHRINVPILPSDSGNTFFGNFITRAYDTIQARFADAIWYQYFKQFDQRTNSNFMIDNSVNPQPDGNIDFLIILFRFNSPPSGEYYKWMEKISHNAYASVNGRTFTFSNGKKLSFNKGFTIQKGVGEINSHSSLFIHEDGHAFYEGPHVFGANGVVGEYFYTGNGWGGVASQPRIYYSYNAWDRWWLKWIEIKHDLSKPEHNGIYELGDFITTGDAMRLELPTPDKQYVWFENRTGHTPFDERLGWTGNEGYVFPPSAKGLVAFVEATSNDYSKVYEIMTGKPNTLRVLNPTGNFDYAWTTYRDGSAAPEWFKNRIYDYTTVEANPFSAHNSIMALRDDFFGDSIHFPPNEIISVDTYWNSANKQKREQFSVIELDGEVIWGPLGHNIAFEPGKKVSISTNPGLIAQQKYSMADKKLDPIYLHGLSVEVLSYTGTGVNRKARVKVKYDDFLVDRDVRWCGNIILPDGVPLELAEHKTLRIDKSGTANRHTVTAAGDFINPTSLTFRPNATFTLREGSVMEVENGSTLTLESGSKLTLQAGAKLIIKSGSTLNIDDCAELEILPGAQLVVQSGNTLRISPNAILRAHDGHGSFSIHRYAIIPDGFVHPEEVVPPAYRITSTGQVWSNRSYDMHLDLVVEPNASLTLNSSTLRFASGKGVYVKHGALVDGYGGELNRQEGSCAPNERWKGIVVEGRVLEAQTPRSQGRLLLSGTTIENATIGVEVKGGGIANISFAHFHNNIRGVALQPYRWSQSNGGTTQNLSQVTFSTFTHDADILLPMGKFYATVHIDLHGVSGVRIAGNTFENLAPNLAPVANWGYGINALNADVDLQDGANTFTNLFMGIQASATAETPAFTVSGQTFDGCFNGVRVSAYSMPVISGCQFLVPSYSGSEGVPTAISITNLNSFSVEGNSLSGAYSGYGIYLENRLPCSGHVIGNSLEHLSVGISAEGTAGQGANTVQVLCNRFDGNAVADILVRGEGLAGIQGTPGVSASNQFGRSGMHLISEDVPLVYYGYPQSGYLPTEVSTWVRVLESDALSDCSTRLMAGFGGAELTGVAQAQSAMAEVEQFIEEVQDMGDTQDVIEAIEELAHTNPLGLRNELLNRSPLLSDTVLVRSSSDGTDLPHIMLAQVLMANPQATKSGEVVAALVEKANPLPYYLMDAILASGSTLSPLDILRSAASSHRATRDFMAGALTHRLVSDTLGKAYGSIQRIGDHHPSMMYQYLSAFAAYESAGSADALLLLNQMSNSGGLTPSQQQELQGVVSLITLLDTADEELFDAESEEYAELVSIAAGENGLAAILADNLISYVESVPFLAQEYVMERGGTAATPPLYGPYVEVCPYPVSQYVIISYGMGEAPYGEPSLRIADRAGKELQALELTYPQFEVLVGVDGWNPGLYTVSLQDGKTILAGSSFVIEGVERLDDGRKEADAAGYPMISVYPNPTPGAIRIVVSGTPDAPFTYDIYNSLGTSLTKGRGVGEKEVDLSRYGKGSYMIVVGANDQRYTLSVMVK